MALIHWQPWQEVDTFRRQLDQLVDEIVPLSREVVSTATGKQVWAPAIELKLTDTDVTLRAELPGIASKDLDIQVTREAVSIAGECRAQTKTEGQRLFRSEFRYGHFRRVVQLPVAVQNDQVKAEFKDGVLTLTLPKLQADRPKVVKITLGESVTAPAAELGSAAPAAQSPVEDAWADEPQA